jgi:hypothetical protein
VEPPQHEGETVPQQSSEDPQRRTSAPRAGTMVSAALRERLADPAIARSRALALEAVWDWVWWRRVAYFVTLGLTLLLVLMPAWVEDVYPPPVLSDGRTWLGTLIRGTAVFLPSAVEPWIATYADNSVYFLLLAGATSLVILYSARCELRPARPGQAGVARVDCDRGGPPPRTSEPERPATVPERHRLPAGDPGLQVGSAPERRRRAPHSSSLASGSPPALTRRRGCRGSKKETSLCSPMGPSLPELTVAQFDFSPRESCVPTGVSVRKGQPYLVTFDVVDEWREQHVRGVARGTGGVEPGFGDRLPWLHLPARCSHAGYLQPAIEIRPGSRPRQLDNVYIYPLEVEREERGGNGRTLPNSRRSSRANC